MQIIIGIIYLAMRFDYVGDIVFIQELFAIPQSKNPYDPHLFWNGYKLHSSQRWAIC